MFLFTTPPVRDAAPANPVVDAIRDGAEKTGTSFDYQQALDDPCRIFGQPGNVLAHPDLDARQKREILESWRQDAVRLSESEGENMGGGSEPMLKRVNYALL